MNHGSFLGSRSFGSDPGVVAQAACAFADGLQSAGVNATLKHFPASAGRARTPTWARLTIGAVGRGAARRASRGRTRSAAGRGAARDAVERDVPGVYDPSRARQSSRGAS